MELFVSPQGSDDNLGSEAQPLASLCRARDLLRTLRQARPGPLTVYLRGGTHFLAEPFILGPDDSGSEPGPITYAAYPGEPVTLSGGAPITGPWQPHRDRRGSDGIWVCALPARPAGGWRFDQLFANGRRQVRARYPNYDPQGERARGMAGHSGGDKPGYATGLAPCSSEGAPLPGDHPGWLSAAGAARWLRYDGAQFSPRRWAQPRGAVLHAFQSHYWGNLQYEIEAVDHERGLLRLGRGGWQIKYGDVGEASHYYVENVFEELDAPGEWYLDGYRGLLYYWPPAEIDLASAQIVAPLLQRLVEFRGSQDNPVQHVTLKGLRLAHTAATFLEGYERLPSGDWCIHRGGAVFFEGAHDCAVERCDFDAAGGNGVFINDHNRRIRVADCRFAEGGESAICIVGSQHRHVGTADACPAENTIHNNLIHDCGTYGKQVAGVFCSFTRANTISHNEIHGVPRAGICLNDGYFGGHLIEYNRVYDTVRETGDHGPLNAWGRGQYWCLQQSHSQGFAWPHEAGEVLRDTTERVVIRHNVFVDRHGWGIDLDDGSSNYLVYGNLCVGISIKLREGDHRLVENNVFYKPAVPPGFHVGYDHNHDRFVGNIIVVDPATDRPESDASFLVESARGDVYQLIWPPTSQPWLYLDGNLFWDAVQRFQVTAKLRDGTVYHYGLAEWQALGYDVHSLFADPQFADPDAGDFSLRPDSPALKMGFPPLKTAEAGLLGSFPAELRRTQGRNSRFLEVL